MTGHDALMALSAVAAGGSVGLAITWALDRLLGRR